jgi:hypothetical protein
MNQTELDNFVKQIRALLDCNRQCQQKFDEAVKHGLSAQRTKTLFSDLSISTKLSVLENAIDVLQDSCDQRESTCNHRNLKVAMFPLLFKILRRLSTQQHDIKVDVAVPNQGPSTSKVTSKLKKKTPKSTTSAISTEQPVRQKETPPVGLEAEEIYRVILSRLGKKHPLSNFKHITCDSLTCSFCKDMFFATHLTKCVGHKPCVPGGWYPHVGVILWNQLKRYHDNGKEYVCNAQLREHCMPSLNCAKSQISRTTSTINEVKAIAIENDQAEASTDSVSMDLSILNCDASNELPWADEAPILSAERAENLALSQEVDNLRSQLAEFQFNQSRMAPKRSGGVKQYHNTRKKSKPPSSLEKGDN